MSCIHFSPEKKNCDIEDRNKQGLKKRIILSYTGNKEIKCQMFQTN